MPAYKTRTFSRWMRGEGLTDRDPHAAIGERWAFMFGFAKNERDNINDEELRLMKRIATALLGMNEAKLRDVQGAGELMEIKHGQ